MSEKEMVVQFRVSYKRVVFIHMVLIMQKSF